jgi:hypothetical protein
MHLGTRALALLCATAAASQTPVPVGRISGSGFRVTGQVEFASDGSALLLSGTEVEVRGGSALLQVAGGEARFCGPLKLIVLKSAPPAAQPGAPQAAPKPDADMPLLFALFSSDSGAIELDYTGAVAYTVQTPFFSVSTLPMPDPTARKAAVRVGAGGEVCAAAQAGTLRVREQIGTSDLLIPPGKAMLIPAAGVDKATPVEAAWCGCRPAGRKAEGPPAETRAPAPVAVVKEPPSESDATIAAAPLVYKAEPGAAAQPAAPPKEPEVTIPVVMTGPQPAGAPTPAGEKGAANKGPPVVEKAAPAARSGFGSKLRRLFRFLFGAR